MTERLRYEEVMSDLLTDIPLPDENLAWADMRRRLEEDDDRPLVAWWRRGCLLWAFLLVGILAAGWYLFRPDNWFRKENKKETIVKTEDQLKTSNKKQEEQKNTGTITTESGSQERSNVPPLPDTTSKDNTTGTVNSGISKTDHQQEIAGNSKISQSANKPLMEKGNVSLAGGGKKGRKKTSPKKPADKVPETNQHTEKVPVKEYDTLVAASVNPPIQKVPDSVDESIPVKKDTAASSPSDSAKSTDNKKDITKVTMDSANKKNDKKEKEKTPYVFSAGIAIHQQLPIAGQKLTPYNSAGRKGSLADYIPSVYLRLEKEKKWFLQSEFRYGAPQYSKEFAYRQSIIPDTGTAPAYSTITTNTLKKTFYHQLPLTFNYFIAPGWSVGGGMQWNKFVSAVSERNVSRKNNTTLLDSVVSKIITKDDTAGSVFRKSYWQAVIESQYKWKRFSFGARYAFGLEPYIRFQLPGEGIKEERNHVVQFFIRYELWRQRKE